MGGWDVYCAICGGPMYQVFWDPADDDESCYDQAIFSGPEDPALDWLMDCRVIGENPNSESFSKTWISGKAQSGDYGTMEMELGDPPDPNLAMLGETSISVYMWDGSGPSAIPFHSACREVLCRYMGTRVSDLDKDIFFECLRNLGSGDLGSNCLDKMDYGEISGQMEQYWPAQRHLEYLVSDPVEDRALQISYQELPQFHEAPRAEQQRLCGTAGDPFAKLAPEILMQILSCSDDIKTVFAVKEASPTFRNLKLTNGWWKNQLRAHMPWLWDLPELSSSTEVHGIDWRQVYRKFWFASGKATNKTGIILGLRNRRRIWCDTCPTIAKSYWDCARKARTSVPETLQGSFSTEQTKLISPIETDTHQLIETFTDNFLDLPSANPSVSVCWKKNGILSAIYIENGGDWNTEQGRQKDNEVSRTDTVAIPDGDWITGFIIVSLGYTASSGEEAQEDLNHDEQNSGRHIIGLQVLFTQRGPVELGETKGDKRLVYVSEGRFVVGLKTRVARRSVLCNMCLVEQDVVHARGHKRVIDHNRDNYNAHLAYQTHRPSKIMWHEQLLQPGIELRPALFGYWSDASNVETSPMSKFVWATSEAEQADIVSIAAEVQFCGFRVSYGSRPSTQVGSRHLAMKTLEIDGKGGERIVDVRVGVNHIPNSIRFVTNRGRQLIIGGPGPRDKSLKNVTNSANALGPTSNICGLYAWWDNSRNGNLDIIGGLCSPTLGSPHDYSSQPDQEDMLGFPWEPERPPLDLVETGPVYGKRESTSEEQAFGVFRENIPSEGCVVSWLDCGRPVSAVRVTTVHGTVSPRVNISSIKLAYTDGTCASVGPSEFPEEPVCGWCHLGHCREEELQSTPHYQHHEWKVGGKLIVKFRFWANKQARTQAAVQMVAEDNVESPVWGYWGREEEEESMSEMSLGNNHGELVTGIKVFLEANGRSVTRDDTIITAFQALKKHGEVSS